MLAHPEFEDLERMRALFRTFEEKGPAGEDPERLPLRRRHPDPDRPREPRSRPPRPGLCHRVPARGGRSCRTGPRSAGLDPHGVRPRGRPGRPRGPRPSARPSGRSSREQEGQTEPTRRTAGHERARALARAAQPDPGGRPRVRRRAGRRRPPAPTRSRPCAASATSSASSCCAGAPISRTTRNASSAIASRRASRRPPPSFASS